jgi:hypothetical protein
MHCLYRQYRRIIALLLIVLHAGFVVIVDQINIHLIINGLVIAKMCRDLFNRLTGTNYILFASRL